MPCRFLTKDYTFIYLPHIEGLKGNLPVEYQAKVILLSHSYVSLWLKFWG
jgi:hypothetical protein